MRYSLKNTLLAGASAVVLSFGAISAKAGIIVEVPEETGTRALINVEDANTVENNTAEDNGSIRDNLISGSHNDSSGINHVQQNNGNANAISAATAVTGERNDFVANPLTVRAETNSNTRDNFTNHNGADEELPDRNNRILGSFEGFAGIATVQQNNGDHNEIGAATAVHGSAGAAGNVDQDSLANSDTQNQQSLDSEGEPTALTDEQSDRRNLINPSFTNFKGIATVQQNNGNANAMSVATSVAASAGAGDVDQDADANADANGNNVVDNSINRTNQILGSFNGAAGIATVQQNNGDANAMSVATSVAADVDEGAVPAGTIGNPQDIIGSTSEVEQDADSDNNEIGDITATDNSTNRSNLINPSFTDFAGVATVQQNNGSANQMSVANGAIGITGNVVGDGLAPDSFDAVDQEIEAEDNNVGGGSGTDDITTVDNSTNRENEILGSFNGAKGIITVQQNNGDANTMNAANGVIGVGGNVTSVSGNALDQDVESDNNDTAADNISSITTTDNSTNRENLIDPSFVGAAGIVTVQQNNGDANTMNAASGVEAVAGNATTSADDHAIDQDIDVDESDAAESGDIDVTDNSESRDNTITDGSFEDADGIITVQQNNGDANTINSASGTIAVGGNASTTGTSGDGINQDIEADQNDVADFNEDLDADDNGSNRNNTISEGSFDGAAGIVTVQQNNGNANTMNVGVGLVGVVNNVSSDDEDAVDQEVSVESNDVGGSDGNTNIFALDDDSTRSNDITGSFDGASGIVTVQQNNGDANTMNVGVGVVGIGDDVDGGGDATAGSDTDDAVNQDVDVNSNNVWGDGLTADDQGGTRTNTVSGSFNNAMGVVTVQQNNGNANTMNVGAAVVGIEGDATGDVVQDVEANNNSMEDISSLIPDDAERTNTINPSFQGAQGVITVQQNNGNANTINVAAGVIGIGGDLSEEVLQDADAQDNNIVNVFVDPEDVETFSNNIAGGSFNDAGGVITVQQNNGNVNSMNTAVAVLGIGGDLGDGNDPPDDLTQSIDAEDNTIDNVDAIDNGSDRDNSITGSINNAAGVITVQQNNGNANTMNAAIGVAGVDEDVATQWSDINNDADAENNDVRDTTASDEFSERTNLINPSFNGASGVITVQQNNGDANTMNAATAIAAIGTEDDGGGPVDGDVNDDIQHDTEAQSNDIDNVEANDDGAVRSNDITSSFDNAAGAITVQQNNGNANTMNAATAVATAQGDVGDDVEEENDETSEVKGNDVDDVSVTTSAETDRSNSITNSFTDATGVITVQQNNGDANTINAATSVATVRGNVAEDVQHDDVEAEENDIGDDGNVTATDNGSNRPNLISGSFNGAAGVITVQQNDGNANSLNAATAVAHVGGNVGGDLDQKADGDLNSVFGLNVFDNGSTRDNDITNSFNGAAGVITVQQNNGDANTINAATSVASVGGDVDDNLDQEADTGGNYAIGTFAKDIDVVRTNDITDSFNNGTAGVVTVQQNNGNANTINAATAVAAHIGGTVGDDDDASEAGTQDITQAAVAGGGVVESLVIHNAVDPINTITNSFTGFHGTATVQQNNGNANTINASTAVMVNAGANVPLDQDATSLGLVLFAQVDDNLVETRRNEILNSFNGASGIFTVQQNNGDNNVMAASTAVAHSSGAGNTDDSDQQVISGGAVLVADAADQDEPTTNAPDRIGERDNLIDPSFNGASGVSTVQQNNGSNNVIASATAVFADETRSMPGDGAEDSENQTVFAGGLVAAAVTAEQTSQGGAPDPDDRYDRNNRILVDSFDNYSGVATVQQNNGDNNVVSASTGVFAHLGDPNNPANTDEIDEVEDATARTLGAVYDVEAIDTHGNRRNEIDSSFDGAAGVVTVQQNNGNNNVVLSATGVVANLDATHQQPQEAVDSEAIGDAWVVDNVATASELVDRLNTINNSFNGFNGVGTIQQNNGDNNVMGSATQVTASNNLANGFGPASTLADLDATVSGNTTIANGFVVGPGYANAITNSFNGAAGVVTVQQNNGSNNVVQSAISVGANF